jgi:hypothetical protein
LPLKSNNKNILFALCLKGENSPSSTIYFLSIANNWDYEETALEFLEKINNDKNFPLVEFDKCGILIDEILFSHKEKDILSDRIICYPLNNIDLSSNIIFYEKKVYKQLRLKSNDPNDFKENQLNESIIEQIEDNQYETLIISAIEGGYWDYKLSLQEKRFVRNSDTFILSGRPGTGKTTVILFKLFSIYFNYKLKKKNRLDDYQNYNNNINTTSRIYKITESLRVVFTSLSQSLCEKQRSIFEETMVRKIDELADDYFPLSNDDLKLISSFRGLSKYPIFANFRKIMFMLDGSLTFQFFSRHELLTYEGDHKTEYY